MECVGSRRPHDFRPSIKYHFLIRNKWIYSSTTLLLPEWRQRRVGLDYRVDIDGPYYSVLHRLLRQQVGAHHERTVELFHRVSGSLAICWVACAAATPPYLST